MVAQHGGEAFVPLREVCLQSLKTAIEFPMDASVKEKKSKASQFHHARDNAVAALGKVLQFQNTQVDLNTLVPFWLAQLPLTHDMDEAKIQNKFLGEAILRNPTAMLGAAYERLEQFVVILGEICTKKQSDPQTLEMLSVIVANISQDANLADNFKILCESKLKEENRNNILDVYNKCNQEVRDKVQAHLASQ